ncbi:MAG: 50S ribosomal protein L7/L12 [Candidatus Saccharibacteria bacterium]
MAEETAKQEEVKEETATPAEETKETKEVPAKFKSLVDQISELSVLDLSELVKVLEDHFGVSAAAPVAIAAGGAAAGEEDAVEAKSSYNVYLAAVGDKKIDVIKAVREVSGLGLAESKAVVDGAPTMVKEAAPAEEAEEAKKKLEEAGATIELQ